MRAIFAMGATCIFLVVRTAAASSQVIIFRPALDAIGNAESPKSETPQVPPDVGLDSEDVQQLPSRRGRVVVESGTLTTPARGIERRKMWQIER
jgi:hypothetical protein